jgi:dihydroorotase
MVFEEEGALDRLEAFASENGPNFYGLPLNEGRVTLEPVSFTAPERIEAPNGGLVPFLGGEEVNWRFAGSTGG